MNYIAPQSVSFHQPPEESPFLWLPDIVSFLRRQWRTILASMVAVIALTSVYLVIATPKFSATAELVIDVQRADPFKQIPITIGDSSAESALVDSQVEIVRSSGVIERVTRKLDLVDDLEFQSFGHSIIGDVVGAVKGLFLASDPLTREQSIEMTAQTLSRLVDVRRIGLTYVLEIDVRTPSATRSAQIANALVAEYLDEQIDAKRDTAAKAKSWLESGISEMRDHANDAAHAVQLFRAENQIVNIDRVTTIEQKLAEVTTALTTAHSRLADAQARSGEIEAILQYGFGHASVSDAIQNLVIVRLRQQFLDASKRMAELSLRYGPDHVAVARVKQEMEDLQASGQNELGRIAQSYRSDLAIAEANDRSAQQDYDAQLKRAVDANKVSARLRDLESSADIYRTLYQDFLQRYTQALQDQSFPIPQARVFAAAVVPLKSVAPNVPLFLAGGTVLGLLLGFAIGFIREGLDRGLRLPSDVFETMRIECLALMPVSESPIKRTWDFATAISHPRLIGAGGQAVAAPSPNASRSSAPQGFAEALHAIRARLAGIKTTPGKSIVIGLTSAVPGEGKTTLAVNLAQMLAECGSRTLLLDWDLRSIAMSKKLIPGCDRGMQDAFSGQVDVNQLIRIDGASGLHLLPASHAETAIDAGMILGSGGVESMLMALRDRYDYIVVDLPAILPCSDAQLVWHLIDEFIFVVAWGATDRNLVEECMLRRYFDPAHILGVVLNKVDPKILRRYA